MASWRKPKDLRFTRHALRQMLERDILPTEVSQTVQRGEVIAEYLDDAPFPSRLVSAIIDLRPVHVVVAYDQTTGVSHVVTAYRPDPARWDDQFRRVRN